MPGEATTNLFTQGVLGVVVVALVAVVVKLYNKVESLQVKIEALHELRLQDSILVTKNITDVLQENSQSFKLLSEKIEAAKSRGS